MPKITMSRGLIEFLDILKPIPLSIIDENWCQIVIKFKILFESLKRKLCFVSKLGLMHVTCSMCYFTWYETRKGIRWHGVWWHMSVWRTNLWCSTKSLRNLVGIFSIVFVKSRLFLRRRVCPCFLSIAWLDCKIFRVFCIVWVCDMVSCSS